MSAKRVPLGTPIRTTVTIDGRVAGHAYIPAGTKGTVARRHKGGEITADLDGFGERYLGVDWAAEQPESDD